MTTAGSMRPGSAGWARVGGRAQLVGDLAERVGQGMDLAAFPAGAGPGAGGERDKPWEAGITYQRDRPDQARSIRHPVPTRYRR